MIEKNVRAPYLISISPVVIGIVMILSEMVFKCRSIENPDLCNTGLFTVWIAATAITGYAAVRFMMSFSGKCNLNAFAYYRFSPAAVIICGIWLKI